MYSTVHGLTGYTNEKVTNLVGPVQSVALGKEVDLALQPV